MSEISVIPVVNRLYDHAIYKGNYTKFLKMEGRAAVRWIKVHEDDFKPPTNHIFSESIAPGHHFAPYHKA